MPTILVTGGAGLLGGTLLAGAPQGWELHATWRRSPVRVSGVTAHQVDLADPEETAALLRAVHPHVVVHTAYDKADGERDILRATANVAAACAADGADLVHLSSDVVFDGESAPYAEDDPPQPVHDYGRWKAEAEAAVRDSLPTAAVVRTSLLLSLEPLDPTSTWIVEALRRGERPALFTDELRCPLGVGDLAVALWELIALAGEERAGVWHLVGPEAVSRLALGLLLARRLGLAAAVDVARNRDLEQARPRDLRLRTDRADRVLRWRPRGVSELLG